MADVKWIKIATGLPDNKKIKQIRKLPDGDTIALMWVFLMCLAGDVNEQGLIYITPEVPYTDEMLAEEFRIDVNTIRLGLATFQKFGMLEIIDDILCVSNWEKWQSVDRLSEIREYNRIAKQKSRAKQKLLASVNDKSMTSQRCQDTEEDKEKDKEKELEINNIITDSDESPPDPPVEPKKGKAKKEKPPKHKYGEYQRVLLTDEEHERLCNEYGIEFMDKVIQFFDEYIEEKGYKSQSHNLAIRRWVIDAVKEKEAKQKTKSSYTDAISNRVSDVDNW